MIYKNITHEMWVKRWKLEADINTYEFFKLKNIPPGCKGTVEKKLNDLKLKHDELYRMV